MDSFCRLIFKRFDLFSWIQRILTNPDESLVHRRTSNKPKSIQIQGFGFANLYWFQKIHFADLFCRSFLKDLFCRFVSWIRFWKIGFVDWFCESKNPKLLDSFCFGKIRIRIPHPYKNSIKLLFQKSYVMLTKWSAYGILKDHSIKNLLWQIPLDLLGLGKVR